MYHFSRAIYRELAPYVVDERPAYQRETNRQLVLQACEEAMQRLATDSRHFARPARALFRDIRTYFPISRHLWVYMVIEQNVNLALTFISRFPEYEYNGNGAPRQCQAMTRKGRPCQRRPLPRSDYCPSHQHLTEDFAEFDEAAHELEGIELAA